MKVIAFNRTEQGTGASRRLRNANTTPGIVYGGGKPAANIKLDHNPLYHAINREVFHSSILDLEIDGVSEPVVLRDFQMHAFKPIVMHIDFQRVVPDQKISIRVPLHFINADICPASKVGGSNISHAINTVNINCLPKDLPEYITVDLAALSPGQTIHLSDVKMPDGVVASDNPKLAVAIATVAK
ncbi:MAG: 50S ribosomal protein L25/general stress protein Ctc [Oxalobacter sp.]|nr:MAG: 50S ribosomal protein L25/general stress protein Ctc [Oxalobacter sp.]